MRRRYWAFPYTSKLITLHRRAVFLVQVRADAEDPPRRLGRFVRGSPATGEESRKCPCESSLVGSCQGPESSLPRRLRASRVEVDETCV